MTSILIVNTPGHPGFENDMRLIVKWSKDLDEYIEKKLELYELWEPSFILGSSKDFDIDQEDVPSEMGLHVFHVSTHVDNPDPEYHEGNRIPLFLEGSWAKPTPGDFKDLGWNPHVDLCDEGYHMTDHPMDEFQKMSHMGKRIHSAMLRESMNMRDYTHQKLSKKDWAFFSHSHIAISRAMAVQLVQRDNEIQSLKENFDKLHDIVKKQNDLIETLFKRGKV